MNINNVKDGIGAFAINNNLIPENRINKKCIKEELVLPDPATWESIVYAANRVLKEPNSEGYTDLSPIFENDASLNEYLSNAKFTLKQLRIYGEYHPGYKDRHINYYDIPGSCFEIVMIHERFHAIHNLTLDGNDDIWKRFPKVPAYYKELLAQIFTYKYIELHRPELLDDFLELNKNQPFIYQTWRMFQSLSWDDIVRLYWEIRNRINNNKPLGILGQINEAINHRDKVTHKKKENGMKIFNRKLPSGIIKNQKNSPKSSTRSKVLGSSLPQTILDCQLWTKLRKDILTGEVFLAIRDNYIDFYYQGGKLFEWEKNHCKTHRKFAAVINSKNNYISEHNLKKCSFIRDFANAYDTIKENCKQYSGDEDLGIAYLYHKFGYANWVSDIIVLDIEIAFSNKNRLDILLYNKKDGELKFIEAKHYSNRELRSKTTPQICTQIKRYDQCIKTNEKNILTAYKEYIKRLQEFSLLPFTCNTDLHIAPQTKLYIFGFDNDQKNGKLKDLIKTFKDIPIYAKGNPEEIKISRLWEK